MIIEILGLLNVLLTLVCAVLLFVSEKADNLARYKICVIRIILASIVAIFAAIIVVNKIAVDRGWVFDLILMLLQPIVVAEAIKYVINFAGIKEHKVEENLDVSKIKNKDYPTEEAKEVNVRIIN